MTTPNPFDLAKVQAAVNAGRLQWRLHVLQRMPVRGIDRLDVIEALASGAVIEDYPTDTPYPSALVLGFVGARPLHVVVALDKNGPDAYVITVYEPSSDKFEPDWKTRRIP